MQMLNISSSCIRLKKKQLQQVFVWYQTLEFNCFRFFLVSYFVVIEITHFERLSHSSYQFVNNSRGLDPIKPINFILIIATSVKNIHPNNLVVVQTGLEVYQQIHTQKIW